MRTLKLYTLLLASLLFFGSKAVAQCTFASITTQPSNYTLCSGGAATATFTVGASGTGPLTYQWQVNSGAGYGNISNGLLYSGVNTQTLTITNPTLAMSMWDYRVEVAAPCGGSPVRSSGSTLIIYTQLSIYQQPLNSNICPNGNTSFTVGASALSGNNLITYQWQANSGSGWANVSNTGIYSGATTSTLSLTNVPAGTFVDYRCFLTGPCNPAPAGFMSNTAAVAVYATPAIATSPVSTTICPSQNATFNVTATGQGLTYQWQENNGGGFVNISPVASGFGGTQNTSSLTVVSPSTATNGYQYRCAVSGTCGSPAISGAATLNFNTQPAITLQPNNSTLCESANATFTVAATGTGVAYQWQIWNGSAFVNLPVAAPFSGTTSTTLTIQSITLAMNNTQYRCVAYGTCTPVAASNPAMLTVMANPTISTQPLNLVHCGPVVNTSFSVVAAGAGLTYQWQGDNGPGFTNLTNSGIYSNVNTASLSITGATIANTGSNYRCVIIGTCGAPVISAQGSLTINVAPVVTTSPFNTAVCELGNTSLSVAATGTALTYQWQVSVGGGGWSNLTNTAPYSNVNAATMNITSAPLSINTNRYRCYVMGTCTPFTSSAPCSLTVNQLPVVSAHPVNTTICSGTNVTFNVTAAAGGIAYQWQENTGSGFVNIGAVAPYSGYNAASLTIQNVPPSYNGYLYRCVISGNCTPQAFSNPAALTVNQIPTITGQPANSTICAGATTSFNVTAAAAGISYQWQENQGSGFVNLTNTFFYSGVTTSSLVISAATYALNGFTYRCVISGTCAPQAFTNAAILTVNPLPLITGQPANAVVCAGSNTSFTTSATGTGLGYQWQVNTGSGFSNLSNAGVYSNVTTPTLNITGALTTMNGYQYQCVITSTCGTLVTTPRTLTVNALPFIIIGPSSSVVCANTATTFSVIATGTSLTYQWQVNDGSGFVNASGSAYANVNSATMTVTPPNGTYSGYTFRCVVGGICSPSQTSTVATLSVYDLPVIISQPSNLTVCTNGSTSFSVGANGTGLVYQWQENKGTGFLNLTNGGVYSGVTNSVLNVTGVPYTMNGYQYRCIVSGTCAPSVTSGVVSLTVTPLASISGHPADMTICFNNTATFTVTAVGTIYQWQEYTGTVWANISNGGVYGGATTKTLTINNTPYSMSSNQYRCVVSTTCAPSVTSNPATLTVYAYPVIATEPTSDTVCEGTPAMFNVVATGLNLQYQWEVNTGSGWTNINPNLVYMDPQTATLGIANVPMSMTGYNFRCKITGDCGYAYTQVVSLNIKAKPYITFQPVGQLVAYNAQTKVKFYISAMGAGPLSFQWQADTTINGFKTYVNISNSGPYSGVNTDTLTITNPPAWVSHKRYQCIVSGNCAPAVVSGNAQLIMLFANGVENVANNTDIRLYPNPVTGSELSLMVANAIGRELSVKITNNMGSVLVNDVMTLDNNNSGTINVGNLAAGVYNLQVADKDNNLVKTIRFVKQ